MTVDELLEFDPYQLLKYGEISAFALWEPLADEYKDVFTCSFFEQTGCYLITLKERSHRHYGDELFTGLAHNVLGSTTVPTCYKERYHLFVRNGAICQFPKVTRWFSEFFVWNDEWFE